MQLTISRIKKNIPIVEIIYTNSINLYICKTVTVWRHSNLKKQTKPVMREKRQTFF